MAEPPKPKRPSRNRKAPEPDFSPFEDWLIEGPAGRWPERPARRSVIGKELTQRQKQIVDANAALLLNRDEWLKKTRALDAALSELTDGSHQKDARARYKIRFDEHEFDDGPNDFSNYDFPCSVSFVKATFGEGNVSFKNATFDDSEVSFYGATFGDGNVSFQQAVFGSGLVIFDQVSFGKGSVTFSNANFGGYVSFCGIMFRSTNFNAHGMMVTGHLDVGSHFPELAFFDKLDVKGTASFLGSSFDKVPNFCDAKFERPPEVAGMVVPRPKLVGWNRLATAPDDVAKFRKLKAMALAANDHEKDGEFFAGEMLAKRGTETKTFFGLLFNTLYWWLSDFGQSYLRPIGWLVVSYLIFAAACLYKIWPALTFNDRLWFAADFSFRSLTPLFGSLFRFAPAPKDHVSWYQKTYNDFDASGVDIDGLIALGIAQSVIGTVLLFLLLLALRNKFRLK